MPAALIYTRVSHDRAGGRSPAEQEREARQHCDREGWSIVEVVTDSVGASRHSKGTRHGWKRAQQLLAAGDVDVLVTWEASRAQRDLAAYAELRDLCVRSGVRWSYSGRTYDLSDGGDRFRTGLDALLAEREAEETADRVCGAMRSNAAARRPHGRRLFGYRRVYDDSTGALIGQEAHPDEAPTVQRIFRDYLLGIGIRTIARTLNDEGTTTGTGARWNDSQVRRVITNPAYVSRRVHRGDVIGAGDWPALVDEDTFERATARLAMMGQRGTRQRSTARLLTGVGRCGVCGGKVQAGHDRNQRKVYLCKASFCVARDLVKLDAYVTLALLERLDQDDRPDVADSEPAAAVLEARRTVDELRARLASAVEEFTAGRLTAATLSRVELDLEPKIAAAERDARRALVPIEVDIPESGADEAWWNAKTAEQQREIAGAIIAAVIINPAVRGSRTFDPSTVAIEWRTS